MQTTVILSDFDLTEVINGIEYMSPAPSRKHQRTIRLLLLQLVKQVKNHVVVIAPSDLKLDSGAIIQPDLMVIEKEKEFEETALPIIVIEVLSFYNMIHDRIRKFRLYETAGIQEYWLVNPETESIEVYHLKSSEYQLHLEIVRHGEVTSLALPNLKFRIEDIFN
jgi:Uma2 family endonuclease